MCQGIGCCLLSWSVTALPLILGLGPWSLDFGSCDVSSFAQTALGDPQMPVPVHFFSLNTLISMSFHLPDADNIYTIYVFICSFHVLQYAWNHLYHNHTPETLKLYFKKHNATLDWKESLTEGFRATFLYQSKFEFTRKCYIIIITIITVLHHHCHHHRHHHHRSVFAEYFNRFDGKVSPKHNNVKVFKNFYKAER